MNLLFDLRSNCLSIQICFENILCVCLFVRVFSQFSRHLLELSAVLPHTHGSPSERGNRKLGKGVKDEREKKNESKRE